MIDLSKYEQAKAKARENRWRAQGKSRVEHPKYGSVVVPHSSNLAAVENAAEYWGCDLMEIISTARVLVCDQSLRVVRPMEFCQKRD